MLLDCRKPLKFDQTCWQLLNHAFMSLLWSVLVALVLHAVCGCIECAAARDCGSHATAAARWWWCLAFMRMHPSACAGRALGLLAALLLRVGCCVRLTASIRAWAGRRKVVLGK